jgi:SWIM zinc finger
LTPEAVLALAPDASSAKAAQGLLGGGQWPLLGASEAALWGECQGSGSKPYQTQVDRSGPAFKCSCPSRKFPCKHCLALMLLHVREPQRFGSEAAPAWVKEWLDSRQQRAEKAAQPKAESDAAPDPKAAEQREAERKTRRWARLRAGCEDLQRWMSDQLGQGLAGAQGEALKAWRSQAARLVDAQAQGLAQRLLEALDAQASGQGERALHQLGLLQLLLDALARHDLLDLPQQRLLHSLVGWPLDRSEWLAASPAQSREAIVLGVALDEREGKLQERRVWLQMGGERHLVLDHRHASSVGFEQGWMAGTRLSATLHRHPGLGVGRSLCSAQDGVPQAQAPTTTDLEAEWDAVAERLAANPWQRWHPLLLSQAVPLPDGGLWTGAQRLPLRLAEADLQALLALSGGHPLQLFGEWDGERLRPLSAWVNGALEWRA